MKITIKTTSNGYYLKVKIDEEEPIQEFSFENETETELGETETCARLLRTIETLLWPGDQSRYSEGRISIKVKPGDKRETVCDCDGCPSEEDKEFCSVCKEE